MAIGYEVFECQVGYFLVDGVKVGDYDGFWCVVYNDFCFGSGFQCLDILAFLINDLFFQVVGVEVED